jgi:hypothetical protein
VFGGEPLYKALALPLPDVQSLASVGQLKTFSLDECFFIGAEKVFFAEKYFLMFCL